MGWSQQWDSFLRNLHFIVIDEIHEYRGYFGTNFALLLRRFLGKLDDLGVHPQLILATATCANAQEHAQRLTGRRMELVRSDTVRRPRRHFGFIDPRIPDFQFHAIFQLRVARAVLACLSRGLSTIVFCPSRQAAEAALRIARRDAVGFGLDPNKLTVYRAGLTPAQRREIEPGMREGRYSVVFSTNALEIGIDVGKLDACILAGFPDSVMVAWQRIGRVSRAWDRTAYVLFLAMNNAIDQYYVAHIDGFLDKPLDEIVIGVDNEEVMDKHLRYLLHETGWDMKDSQVPILGAPFWNRGKSATIGGAGPVAGHRPAYQQLSLRGGSGVSFRILAGGEEIGTISDTHRFREAFIGAIYGHAGMNYRVVAHTATADAVVLEPAPPNLRTRALFNTVIQRTEILKGVRYLNALGVFYGRLSIWENFSGFHEVEEGTGRILREVPGDASIRRSVRGFWLTLEQSVAGRLPLQIEGLRVLEHLLRIAGPLIIPCDRHDIGTQTTAQAPSTVYLYETVPGGIGIAEKTYSIWQTLAERGIKLAQDCPCENGCPRCIHPPRWNRDVEELNKPRGIEFARAILDVTSNRPAEIFDSVLHGWKIAEG